MIVLAFAGTVGRQSSASQDWGRQVRSAAGKSSPIQHDAAGKSSTSTDRDLGVHLLLGLHLASALQVLQPNSLSSCQGSGDAETRACH